MKLRTFQGKDCGFTAESYSNTCFYNCLYEELKRLYIPYHFGLTYSKFIKIGEWSEDQKGKMIDTCEHEAQIQLFAQKLGLRIRVYTEISPGVVNSDMFMEFGVVDPLDTDYIRIVKLMNTPHFNVLEWTTPSEVLHENEEEPPLLFFKNAPKTENNWYLKYREIVSESTKTLEKFNRDIQVAEKRLNSAQEDLYSLKESMKIINRDLKNEIIPKIRHLKNENFILYVLCIAIIYMYISGIIMFKS